MIVSFLKSLHSFQTVQIQTVYATPFNCLIISNVYLHSFTALINVQRKNFFIFNFFLNIFRPKFLHFCLCPSPHSTKTFCLTLCNTKKCSPKGGKKLKYIKKTKQTKNTTTIV